MNQPDDSLYKMNERTLEDRRWKNDMIIGLALFSMTTVVFLPACHNGFVNWDDNSYVCNRLEVLQGVSWKGVLWALTAEVCANWHPLTVMSLQLDAQLFGTDPTGFHRTAIVLHAVNAVMAYFAISALTGSRWNSFIVAALFAVHPLRVESVAWISERKDLLSGFFFFLTLLSYERYAATPSPGRYLLVASSLALGLCSKSMLVTTPCVLLLLDYWPLRRASTSSLNASPTIRLVLEKIPLIGLSVISSILTVLYQGAAINSLARISLINRVENAIVSVVFYLKQTCWPVDLSPYYPVREISTREFGAALAVLAAITGFAIWQRNRRPYILLGWLWFLGMLVPVSGIIQVGSQARADRYTYLPQVGLFLAIIWTFANIAGSSRRNAVTLTGLVTVFLVACVFVTRQQIPVWHDTVSLWQRVSKCQPNELYVAQNLIKSLINNGNKPEAIRLTQAELLATNDSDCEKIVMLAMLLAVEGEHAACAEALGKAIQHFPQKAELYSNRGKAFAAMGKWHDAADDYRQASKQAPNSASFQFYLAHALGKIGQTEDARRIFSEAVRRSPRWPQNAARDAWRMSTSPDFRERMDFWPVCLAEQAIEAAGEESPQYLDILAAAYAHSGRFDDAIATAQRAIQQADRTRQNTFAELIRKRLELYERHLPYREPGKGTNPTS